MAGKKSVIETGVDKLVKLVSERKTISVKDAAKELGVSLASIEDWADFLEEEDIIGIETKFATTYLTEKRIGKKEVIQKIKAVKEKKEVLGRRIESSINALERDHDEIKMIDSEFQQIKSLLQDNFKTLSKRMDHLQDFRSAHRDIELRQKEFEKEYEARLAKLDAKLQEEQKSYKHAIAQLGEELEQIKKEKEEIEHMKQSERQIESQVTQVNKQLGQLHSEIDAKNRQLDLDEERMRKTEAAARKIQDEARAAEKELAEFSRQMQKSHADLHELEKAFLKDVEYITSGKMEKVGVFKESRELVERIQRFFDKTRNVEEMIQRAEKEEADLRATLEKMARSVQAFTAVTATPQIKKEMDELQGELAQIEQRRHVLSDQMGKLRLLVRAIVK